MKKLFIIVALISLVFAADPSRTSNEGMYYVEGVIGDGYHTSRDSTWKYGSFDTLSGGDSILIFDKRGFEPGWEYLLVRDSLTGDSARDTAYLAVIIEQWSKNDSFIMVDTVDTFQQTTGLIPNDTAGALIMLPLYTGKYIGPKFTVILASPDAGDELVVRGLWLHRRRPISWDRPFEKK